MIRILFALIVLAAATSAVVANGSTDLDPDPTFGVNGIWYYPSWPVGDASELEEYGLRVQTELPTVGVALANYVLTTKRYGSSPLGYTTWDAVLLKTNLAGSPDATLGNGGYVFTHTMLTAINDAVYDPGTGRAYFLGAAKMIGAANKDMAVVCLDTTTTDRKCGGWSSDSMAWIAFDLGGSNNDVGLRLFRDGNYLYVAGYADTSSGYVIAHAKLNRNTGALVGTYGNGGKATKALGNLSSGKDQWVNSIAMSSAGSPNGKYLYFGGAYKFAANEYHGHVMEVDPATGTSDWADVSGNTSATTESVTAVTALANGKIAFAGISGTATTDYPDLMLGELRINRQALGGPFFGDARFCGSGVCRKKMGPTGGVAGQFGTAHILPLAIGERPGNRDLVVFMRGDLGLSLFSPGETYEIVQQYDRNGFRLRAEADIDFPAATNVTPKALLAHGSGISFWYPDTVLVVGSRYYNTLNGKIDYDPTVVQLKANDSIFADTLGGKNSD
ncbi:MAG: hypothetical protein JSR27_05090 [Proteobacteria bacterium]|nr:hypothetical protein [Pseudomonadota bacterium]